MKKILALNLIFAFLLGLVYSSPAIFASSKSINGLPANTRAKNSAQATNLSKAPIVTVVALPAPPIVQVAAAPLALSCLGVSGKISANLIQDEGVINLNEPANCFSLQASTQKFAVENLRVQNLQQTATVQIAYNGQQLQSPDLVPAPLSPQGFPSLPALSFTLVVAALVLRKKITTGLLNLRKQVLLSIGAYRLEILRC